jgi:hypothetical protein
MPNLSAIPKPEFVVYTEDLGTGEDRLLISNTHRLAQCDVVRKCSGIPQEERSSGPGWAVNRRTHPAAFGRHLPRGDLMRRERSAPQSFAVCHRSNQSFNCLKTES